MKIEILYPERCNLYGDLANMDYLRKCLPQAEFAETPLGETPQFAREKVDMVYLGPMTEQAQEQVLEQLASWTERIVELVKQDVVFLCTGNALELFGEAILKEDGSRIPCLGLFPLTAQRDMMHRHNSVFLGSFEAGPVTGFKSQFTTAKTSSGELKLFGVEKGMGLNKNLLGPLLINNPPFTKYLLSRLGVENPTLAFEKEVQAAYEKRLEDFKTKV